MDTSWARRIQSLMDARGEDVQDFAHALGVAERTVRYWLQGKTPQRLARKHLERLERGAAKREVEDD